MSGHRTVRVAIAACLALTGLAVGPSVAQGAFHLMKIREVHEGGGGNADYVELQMYEAGQNFVVGHYLVAYDAAGNQFGTPYQFPSNAPNGDNQRTILVSDTGSMPVPPDFVVPTANFFPGPSGSVCFIDTLPSNGIDCVRIGSTAPPNTNPSPVGNSVLPVTGLAPGESVERTISRGCPTLLEALDDTDDSASDFGLATPSPRNNATPPNETECLSGTVTPDTRITKRPKDKSKKKRVTYEFTSSIPGVTFLCTLDKKPTAPCTSPATFKVKKGKHTFSVAAVLAGVADPTPDTDKFKTKKKQQQKS